MKVNKFGTKTLIATVCAAASTCLVAQAQEASTDVPAPATQLTTPNQQRDPAQAVSDQGTASDQISQGNRCTADNRCSKLIGTQVKDQRGESLGKIDDVVVDYNSGKVSYVAMKVDGSGKHLAIPLAALHPGADGTLTLNADKEKIAQARGFEGNNWPALNAPVWGAQPSAQVNVPDADQTIPTVTVQGAATPDLNVATLPVPAADGNIGNQAVVSSPADQFVTSPTGPFPTFTHVYLPGAVPR